MGLSLEDRLLQYEKNKKITTDKELIEAIESLLDSENSLLAEERDFDFIDEAVEVLLSMKGDNLPDDEVETLSANAINRSLNEISKNETQKQIPLKSKMTHFKIKWLISVAALLSILTITVTAYALGYDLCGMTKQAFDKLMNKVFYQFDNTEIVKTEDFGEYYSIREFLDANSCTGLLLPRYVDKECVVVRASFGKYVEISIDMDGGSETNDPTIYIRIPGIWDENGHETMIVNGISVYFSNYNDVCQGEFQYKNNYYLIKATSREALISIIENMEEISK